MISKAQEYIALANIIQGIYLSGIPESSFMSLKVSSARFHIRFSRLGFRMILCASNILSLRNCLKWLNPGKNPRMNMMPAMTFESPYIIGLMIGLTILLPVHCIACARPFTMNCPDSFSHSLVNFMKLLNLILKRTSGFRESLRLVIESFVFCIELSCFTKNFWELFNMFPVISSQTSFKEFGSIFVSCFPISCCALCSSCSFSSFEVSFISSLIPGCSCS